MYTYVTPTYTPYKDFIYKHQYKLIKQTQNHII